MNRLFTLLLALLPLAAMAQLRQPAKWTFSAKPLGAGKYEVHMTAVADKGWHIYSQHTPDGGPVATSFSFAKNPLVKLSGNPLEKGKLEKKHEPLFGVDVHQYSGIVDFVQVVQVKPGLKTNVAGTVEFMLCNDKECLPPTTLNFSVALK